MTKTLPITYKFDSEDESWSGIFILSPGRIQFSSDADGCSFDFRTKAKSFRTALLRADYGEYTEMYGAFGTETKAQLENAWQEVNNLTLKA